MRAMPGQPPRQGRLAARVELAPEAAVLRIEDDARHRQQQRACRVGDKVGPQHIGPAARPLAELRTRLAGSHQTFESVLQVLDVRCAALVDDDQIEREALHPPIIRRLDKVAGDPDMFDVGDAQHHDRQVA